MRNETTTYINTTTDGFGLVDPTGRFLDVNQAYCRMLGYTREEFLSKRLTDIEALESESEIRDHLQYILANGYDRFVSRQRHVNGTILDVDILARYLEIHGGVFIAFVRDISDVGRATNANPEEGSVRKIPAHRRLDIRSTRLSGLEEVTAGIAHELRQPLLGVRGLAEHMLLSIRRGRQLSADRMHDKLQGIVDQADRMTHILRHVRDSSYHPAGIESESVNLNDVVVSSLRLLGTQLESLGIDVRCRLDSRLPSIVAHPFSLEQVVVNCLTNARDAIEERSTASRPAYTPRRITLRTRIPRSGKPRRALLEITDTGIGVLPDVMPKVFTPFFTTKDPHRGTGLGLSISRSILEEFGGSIALRSNPKSGTTVTIAVPLGDGQA